jgi:hypothetical protein
MKNLLFFLLLFAGAIKLQAQSVDLSTENFSVTVLDEMHLQYTFTLKNTGSSSIQGYGLKIIFSSDNILSEDDRLFVTIPYGNDPSQFIDANEVLVKNGEYIASSPGGYLPAGSWYTFLEVNYSREVVETDYNDNITMGNQVIVNDYVIHFSHAPVITSITDQSFVINTTPEPDLTRIYYLILMDGAPAPSVSTLKNATIIYPWNAEATITGLGPSIDYDVYFLGEYYDGKVTSILKIDVETAGIESPTVIVSVDEVTFDPLHFKSESEPVEYTLKGFHLTSSVVVNAFGKFLVSKDNIDYTNELMFNAGDFFGGVERTVYVKFLPSGEVGLQEGELVHSSTDANEVTLVLSGISYDPAANSFDGLSTLGEAGWTEASIEGYHRWQLISRDETANGRQSSDNKVLRIDGSLNGNTTNEDWVISPQNNLSQFINTPMLAFESYTSGSGTPLKLKYSTNYIGQGPPSDATWTDLDGQFPAENSKTWTLSSQIAVPKQSNIYFAFVYTSTEAQASRWVVDNWRVADALIDIPDFNFSFDNVVVGTDSEAKEIIVHVAGFGPITVLVSDDFEVSLDNTDFSSSVTLTEGQAAVGQTIFIRFSPHASVQNLVGSVFFSGNGFSISRSSLAGSTAITTGIEEQTESMATIYPNPTQGTVYVNSDVFHDHQSNAVVDVINRLGSSVYHFDSPIHDLATNLTAVMRNLPSGIYFIMIRSGDVLVSEKISKE